MAELAETARIPAQEPPIDPEWAIGDRVLGAVAAGAEILAAKLEAAQASRRDPQEVTLIVRVCREFPAHRRRADLLFAHHAAVLPLSGTDREAMLDRAPEQGWPARQLRQEVLKHRVATGDVVRFGNDDPEDAAFVRLARAWNHAPPGAREMLSASFDDAGLADIIL